MSADLKEPTFSRAVLPEPLTQWPRWRRRLRIPMRAIRVEGPFRLMTSWGQLVRCEDGYLVYDRDGLYALPVDQFELSFEPDPCP